MVKKAASSVVVIMLILACFAFVNSVKAQVATPSKAEITVTGIPSGTKSLAVEVTVDSSVVKLGSVSADSGGLGLADSGSKGVGTFSDMDLPATVKITVDLTGVVAGMSNFAVGKVLDMLGTDGVEITGAMATANISSISVASSSTTTSSSSTSSSTGGTGMLSQETFTVMINGQSLNTTNGVNVTLAFGTDGVVTVDTSSLDFMGTGATKLLTEVMGNVLTAAWDGLITDAALTLSGKFKAGSMSGTTTVSVGKVEVAGGTNVTASVASSVNPTSVTNGGGGSSTSSGGGTFVLIGPTSVVGPGKAAIAFAADGVTNSTTAKLNGSPVDFVNNNMTGIAIVNLKDAMSGSLPLSLVVGMTTVDLGSITVNAGTGSKLPKVASARAHNNASNTILRVFGQRFSVDTTSIEIVPTDRATSSVSVKGKVIKAILPSTACIPKGSYVNVTTAQGTAAKKVKVSGSCSNALVP